MRNLEAEGTKDRKLPVYATKTHKSLSRPLPDCDLRPINFQFVHQRSQSGSLRYMKIAIWKITVQRRKTTWHFQAYNPRNR